jgi:hypothetical protein
MKIKTKTYVINILVANFLQLKSLSHILILISIFLIK